MSESPNEEVQTDEVEQIITTEEPVQNKVLSVAEIMAVDDLARQTLDMPEWGGSIVVREITKAEFNELRRAAAQSDDPDAFEREMFCTGVEEPQFSPEQYNMLMQKSNRTVQKILDAISKLSRMEVEDKEAQEKEIGSFPA